MGDDGSESFSTAAFDVAAVLDLTAVLAGQTEHQLDVLARMRAGERRPEPADGVGELERSARRIRCTGERLRLLCGADPGSLSRPSPLPALLDDVVDQGGRGRVTVAPAAPVATVAPRAAAELLHVLAALLDEVLAGGGLGVLLRSRVDPAGLTVELVAEGTGWWEAVPPRRCLADALAERSVAGIGLERPLGGRAGADGSLALVRCPTTALVVPLPAPPERRADGGTWTPAMSTISPAIASPQPAGVDELFGPLSTSSPPSDDLVGTPIFEAIASAWFRDEPPARGDEPAVADAPGPPDWESPGDAQWRAAAARAARPEPSATTPAGLPRRRPGDQMVTPPLEQTQPVPAAPDERVPDRVRDRLATYQRGLRQGRHRAAEPTAPESWWAEPGA